MIHCISWLYAELMCSILKYESARLKNDLSQLGSLVQLCAAPGHDRPIACWSARRRGGHRCLSAGCCGAAAEVLWGEGELPVKGVLLSYESGVHFHSLKHYSDYCLILCSIYVPYSYVSDIFEFILVESSLIIFHYVSLNINYRLYENLLSGQGALRDGRWEKRFSSQDDFLSPFCAVLTGYTSTMLVNCIYD